MELISKMAGVVQSVLGTTNEARVRTFRPVVQAANALEDTLVVEDDSALRARSQTLRERLSAGEDRALCRAEAFALAREVADRRLGMWAAITGQKAGGAPVSAFSDEQWGDQLTAVNEVKAALQSGTDSWDINVPAAVYAVVRKANPVSEPPYRMRAHDVQLIGASVLDSGRIAEMKTGEGKTLVASVAAFYNALCGQAVHIITVNDYLAKRDADWNAPTYRFLGVTVAAIQNDQPPPLRQEVYACDIVYGTNNEFGFDYLRDNLKQQKEEQVQTRREFGIVDEVDSVLIDEARTPLIISGPARGRKEFYAQADAVARKLQPEEHFEVDIKHRQITLTDEGIEVACQAFGVENIYDAEHMHLPHFLDNSLKAHHLYNKDKEYLVHQGEVKIVDEFTGRMMPGRRWSDGLHQAIETKEGVRVQDETQTYATITLQNFFRMYDKLAGMTGTAMTEAQEFNDIYKLETIAIPTNLPIIRRDMADLIYGTGQEKHEAIAEEVAALYGIGQPVLVGTISVEVSELLSELFTRKGIKHNVLNARQHQREADIVKDAGQLGAVTIATNMAGRGTDIVLGKVSGADLLTHWQKQGIAPKRLKADSPELDEACIDLWAKQWLDDKQLAKVEGQSPAAKLELINRSRRMQGWDVLQVPSTYMDGCDVRRLGGLRIIGTERHESRRIDNQLRGRSGRQGDLGSSRFYLSLEDDLMKRFAGPTMANMMRSMGLKDGIPIESRMVSRSVEKAQKRVEEYHAGIRKNLLEYDQVANLQRSQVYSQRNRILEGEGLQELLLDFISQCLDDLVQEAASDGTRGEALAKSISTRYGELTGQPEPDADQIPVREGGDACRDRLMDFCRGALSERQQGWGQVYDQVLRFILLETIDRHWMQHLYNMDHLRHAIGLEGYGQKDPKMRFKEEGFKLFVDMYQLIRQDLTRLIFRVQIQAEQPNTPESQLQAGGFQPAGRVETKQMKTLGPQGPREQPKPDDPCPCGSGAPYRQCHGM
jgi:preprotein translocase subunit SecA